MIETLFLLVTMLLIFLITTILFFIVVPINILRHYILSFNINKYLYTLIKGFDQIGGTMIYGTEDYTISSWTYFLHSKGNIYATYFMKFIDFLALKISYILLKFNRIDKETYEWNKKHCKNSYIDETKDLYEKSKPPLQ